VVDRPRSAMHSSEKSPSAVASVSDVTSPPETLLTVEDVAKAYGKHEVLRGVALELRRGELVGIVGENGAGKSTLLRVLVGLLKPDRGRVHLDGRFGYCPQDHTVFDALTVAENVAYFARAYGLGPGDKQYLAWRLSLLERLDFARYEHTRVAHASGGTRQKLNLMLSLLHQPDVLILDEPYAGFDWETYLRFWELATDLRGAGRSLLIVSHLVYDRERLDRLYHLRDGRLHPD
jgi:ABC-2 type transport system ATP-binding protein